jgi:hypothetical protein
VCAEQRIGLSHAPGADARDRTEEGIHHGVDGARAVARPAAFGHGEVGVEPLRPRTQPARERGDHLGKFAGREAIEEEIGHDGIEARGRRLPGGQRRVDEFHAAKIEVCATRASLGLGEHAGAGVEIRDRELRESPCERTEKMSVAAADNQEVLAAGECLEPRRAAALQARAGEGALHPRVVGREAIETHVVPPNCQTQPDTTAPAA